MKMTDCEARLRGVGGDRAGQVAGRRATDGREAQLVGGLRGGDGHRPILEREGRVDGVVLEPQVVQAERLAEAVGADEGRATGLGVDDAVALDRQQGAVAPQAGRALLDAGAADAGADGVVVVGDLERPEAVGADVERLGRVQATALAAAQAEHAARGGCPVGRGGSRRVGDQHRRRFGSSLCAAPPWRERGTQKWPLLMRGPTTAIRPLAARPHLPALAGGIGTFPGRVIPRSGRVAGLHRAVSLHLS